MRGVKVESVMTREVVTAGPGTSMKDLAVMLSEHGVSGLPVVDEDGKLLGIVTEADLLWSEKAREPKRRSRFLEWFIDRNRLEQIERPTPDLRASDLMTREVVTVEPQTPVREAVGRLLEAGAKRLPVVDAEGRVVGIVSRTDLLRPILRTDEDIRREILEDVIVHVMLLDPADFDVQVNRGVVRLRGDLEFHGTKDILVHLADRTDGVVGVIDELTFRHEDREAWPAPHLRNWPVPVPEGLYRP